MTTEKKVLHLRSSGGMLGAENVIVELCRYSKMFGYAPHVAAFGEPGGAEPDFLQFIPESVPRSVFTCKGKLDLKSMQAIRSYVCENQIDIIHCHGYKENFYTFFSKSNAAKVATNHLWKKPDFKGRIYAHIDAFLLRFFDAVVAVSEEIKQDMLKKGICKNTLKINNGINIARFSNHMDAAALRHQFGLAEDDLVVGMISSLTHEKGHLVALEAMKKIAQSYPQVYLIIVGDGPMESRIQSFIKESGIEKNVILAGRQSKIPEYLSFFDIFLIPSFKEGLPMALLEAMASSKAVIASAVGEIPNVIINQENGLLTNPGDPVSIGNALKFLLDDKENISKLGRNAFQTVASEYDARTMTEKYCRLYDEVLVKKTL